MKIFHAFRDKTWSLSRLREIFFELREFVLDLLDMSIQRGLLGM